MFDNNLTPLPSQQFQAFPYQNRRSQSVFNQLSYTSRQNLQVKEQETPINTLKYQASLQVSPQLSTQKQNQTPSSHPLSYQAKLRFDTSKMLTQNEALKAQLKSQKQKYEAQITKLKRNITFKDQLLDQCQKQIVKIKGTYQTLIGHFDKAKNYQSNPATGKQQDTVKIAVDQQKNQKYDNFKSQKPKNEGGIVPLSMISKTLPRSSSSQSVGKKLTHGLIRNRV